MKTRMNAFIVAMFWVNRKKEEENDNLSFFMIGIMSKHSWFRCYQTHRLDSQNHAGAKCADHLNAHLVAFLFAHNADRHFGFRIMDSEKISKLNKS